ncbi:monovalent cation/H(+) antiporter subunit G [Nakamurella sp.]|uniref:monovalent cation/H(+) antiporter subunit G n=1 Tax=Nakamurella sp. TaxID=1869182 RepID=UPI003B3AD708
MNGLAAPTTVLEWIASVAIVLGALMSLLAGIAVLRFPDTMSRIHAATKPQVLGIMLLMLGVGLVLQSLAVVGVLVLIVILQFVTAPVSAHLTVRSVYRSTVEGGAPGGPATGATGIPDRAAASGPAAPGPDADPDDRRAGSEPENNAGKAGPPG